MKRYLFVIIIAGFLALIILGESVRPRPYDDRLRVERDGVEPFDAQVFYRMLPEWLDAPVEPGDDPPYVRLEDSTLVNSAYIFLSDDFSPDEAETDRLLAYVERGNTVFVAAELMSGPFPNAFSADSSVDHRQDGFGTDWFGSYADYGESLAEGDIFTATDTLFLEEERFGHEDGFSFPVDLGSQAFVGVDPSTTDTLGMGLNEYPSLLRIRHGRGQFLLSTTPLAFTNAVLTGEGDAPAYASAVLSYVPDVDLVLWDDHYKPFGARLSSRATFAMRTPAIRGALLLILFGVVLFVSFRGRRRQRPIPIVTPPSNAEREFARTVGRLYQIRGDTGWLARRRALAFADGLRTKFGMSDADLSDESARRAAARAGRPLKETLALFQRLRNLSADPTPEASRLVAADRDIDAFFRRGHSSTGNDESDRTSPVASTR